MSWRIREPDVAVKCARCRRRVARSCPMQAGAVSASYQSRVSSAPSFAFATVITTPHQPFPPQLVLLKVRGVLLLLLGQIISHGSALASRSLSSPFLHFLGVLCLVIDPFAFVDPVREHVNRLRKIYKAGMGREAELLN